MAINISRLSRGQKIALGIVGVVALIGGGVGLAAWLAGGTGTGAATATEAVPLEVTGGTTTASLYPGATGNISVTIANDNPYPVKVTNIESDGTITSDAGSACDASTGVSYFDSGTTDDVDFTIPANGSTNVTLDGAVKMSNASHTTCQGATFTIPLTATGESAAS